MQFPKHIHRFSYGGDSPMNIQFLVQLCDVEGVVQTHPSCDMIFLPPQTLKYAFQTHDRLCFVMEYANGGEVRPCVTVTWRHTNVTCCQQQQLNVLCETGLLYICPSASSSSSTCRGNECLQKIGRDSMAQRLCRRSSTSTLAMLCTAI